MTTYTLSNKTVKNCTGLDLNVFSYKEVEGPLGGVSVEYSITVLTILHPFKSDLSTNRDAVFGVVSKTFRECENFFSKLSKKYPNFQVVGQVQGDTSTDKRIYLNENFQALSQDGTICSSALLLQFLGCGAKTGRILIASGTELSSKSSGTCPQDFDIFDDFQSGKEEERQSITNIKVDDDETPRASEKRLENKQEKKGGFFDDCSDDDFDLFASPKVRSKSESHCQFYESSPANATPSSIRDESGVAIYERQDTGGAMTADEVKKFLIPGANITVGTKTWLVDAGKEDSTDLFRIDDDFEERLREKHSRKVSVEKVSRVEERTGGSTESASHNFREKLDRCAGEEKITAGGKTDSHQEPEEKKTMPASEDTGLETRGNEGERVLAAGKPNSVSKPGVPAKPKIASKPAISSKPVIAAKPEPPPKPSLAPKPCLSPKTPPKPAERTKILEKTAEKVSRPTPVPRPRLAKSASQENPEADVTKTKPNQVEASVETTSDTPGSLTSDDIMKYIRSEERAADVTLDLF